MSDTLGGYTVVRLDCGLGPTDVWVVRDADGDQRGGVFTTRTAAIAERDRRIAVDQPRPAETLSPAETDAVYRWLHVRAVYGADSAEEIDAWRQMHAVLRGDPT